MSENTSPDAPAKAKFRLRDIIPICWRFLSRPTALFSAGALLVGGIGIGIVGWGGFNWSL